MTLNLNKTILLLIIIGAIVVAVIFFIENSNSQKTIVMGVTEYLNDGNYTINKTSHVFFNEYRSLKPGDTLIIKDKIVQQFCVLFLSIRSLPHFDICLAPEEKEIL